MPFVNPSSSLPASNFFSVHVSWTHDQRSRRRLGRLLCIESLFPALLTPLDTSLTHRKCSMTFHRAMSSVQPKSMQIIIPKPSFNNTWKIRVRLPSRVVSASLLQVHLPGLSWAPNFPTDLPPHWLIKKISTHTYLPRPFSPESPCRCRKVNNGPYGFHIWYPRRCLIVDPFARRVNSS